MFHTCFLNSGWIIIYVMLFISFCSYSFSRKPVTECKPALVKMYIGTGNLERDLKQSTNLVDEAAKNGADFLLHQIPVSFTRDPAMNTANISGFMNIMTD